MASSSLIPQGFMDKWTEDLLTSSLARARARSRTYFLPEPLVEAQAREDAKRIMAEGKAFDVLDAMYPPDCPECGR